MIVLYLFSCTLFHNPQTPFLSHQPGSTCVCVCCFAVLRLVMTNLLWENLSRINSPCFWKSWYEETKVCNISRSVSPVHQQLSPYIPHNLHPTESNLWIHCWFSSPMAQALCHRKATSRPSLWCSSWRKRNDSLREKNAELAEEMFVPEAWLH